MIRSIAAMVLIGAGALAIGWGLGSAAGQQAAPAPAGVDIQVLQTVDLGPDAAGYAMRMRKITFAPGAVIPMHSHKERPEVAYILRGTLTDMRKGEAAKQYSTGASLMNNREAEHQVENKSGKPVIAIGIDVIKK